MEAFADTPHSHAVFLGYGELYDAIQQESKARHNIHLHDTVPYSQVVNVCRSADVGLCLVQKVSLSDYYCLPNKLFEYSFAGVPVLASSFPDISAAVKEFGLGLCCELEVDSIRSAIRQFESGSVPDTVDVEKLHSLSWEAQRSKLMGVYDRLRKEIEGT